MSRSAFLIRLATDTKDKAALFAAPIIFGNNVGHGLLRAHGGRDGKVAREGEFFGVCNDSGFFPSTNDLFFVEGAGFG